MREPRASLARILGAAGIAVLGLAGAGTGLHAGEAAGLRTNEAYVDAVRQRSSLDTDSIDAVFAYVMASLKPEVFVYPTENYHYFDFILNGVPYTGNIRLSIEDRDKGFVHFNYYKTFTRWRRDIDYRYKRYGPQDGVTVSKRGAFLYSVKAGGTERLFHLNDKLSTDTPKAILGPDDSYIGPIFDESGLRFFLVYNRAVKVFHYILDETVPVADELYPSEYADAILMGRRTGFAFYKDKNIDRKILIGVYEENSNVNNYLDGPFDQLPDNFMDGGALREALIDMDPSLKGQIDDYGFWNNDSRYLIGPYLYYQNEEDLLVFDDCARSGEMTGSDYYLCFRVTQPEDESAGEEAEPPAGRSENAPAAKP